MSSPRLSAAELRERGPGALAHVSCARFDQAGAVAAQHRARLGLEHDGRESRSADAPADEKAGIVAHLSRLEGAVGPAEAPRTFRIAFAQCLRRERLAGDRLDLGVVPEPKIERIHAACPGRLVDRAFERGRSRRLAGRPHEQRRADVDADDFVRRGNCWARIERVRYLRGRFDEIVEGARHRLDVMVERRQAALVVDADAKPLTRRAVDGPPGRTSGRVAARA